ncbi:pectin acetylesterase 5-like [Wolffia australiana]
MASAIHRAGIRRQKLSPGLAVLIACGLLILSLLFVFGPRNREIQAIAVDNGDDLVPLMILRNAKKKGAVCLDGSAPGLHIDQGYGTGIDRWVIHLEGGGWCSSVESCLSRTKTAYGSSNLMKRLVHFPGILSRNQTQNPDFYNWNRVLVRYCDGGSFSGNVENEIHDGERLFFRGQRIWEAVMDDLSASGLATAKQALLTGCSAGGLATFIHCDAFRARLPLNTTVKCFADAGFFLDIKDISGSRTMRSFYHDTVKLHGIAANLPEDCTRRTEPSQCFFPEEVIKSITTPLFILNPTYDSWQIQHVLVPARSDPNGLWLKCKSDITDCDSKQIEILQEFHRTMVSALEGFGKKGDAGLFLNSCYVHCQTLAEVTWHSSTSPRLGGKSIAKAVGDWYFDRAVVDAVDCPFPCNPTCYNMRFV